jgi:hypothetical protein
MHNAVYCLTSVEEQADAILQELRTLGYTPSEVSVILRNQSETKNISAKEDVIKGAETGGLLGGLVGWVAGLSALVLPGMALIGAGPLLAAFGGAAVGGVVGGLAGGSGAVHLGLPHDIAEHVHNRLRDGHILISVHSDETARLERATHVFRENGATEIYQTGDELAA